MSLARKIAHNTAIQIAGKVIGTGLSLVAAGMLLRYLGDAGYGQYATIVGFLQLFGILMDLGLYIILVKHIAEINEHTAPKVNNIFTLRVLSGIFFLGIAPMAAWVLGFYNDTYTHEIVVGIIVTTLFFFFISMNQLLSAVFQKFLRADWIALGELAGKLVLLLSTIVLIWMKVSVIGIMLTLVLSSGVNFIINYIASRKYFKLQLALDKNICKEILIDAWPIAVSIAFGVLYFKGDIFILTFFESDEAIGWYGAPYKILEVLITFPAMFTGLVLPVLAGAWQSKDTVRLQNILQKSFDALALFTIPMVLGVVVLAPHIMQVLAGSDFSNSTPILQILILATGAIFLATLFGYVVPAIDKQKTMMWGYGFVAITTLIGYMIIIPRYSIIGAAWMTVYSEWMVLLISFGIIVRSTHIHLSLRTVLKSFISAGSMFIFLIVLTPRLVAFGATISWIASLSPSIEAAVFLAILIPAGALVYAAVLFGIGGLRMSEIKDVLRLKES